MKFAIYALLSILGLTSAALIERGKPKLKFEIEFKEGTGYTIGDSSDIQKVSQDSKTETFQWDQKALEDGRAKGNFKFYTYKVDSSDVQESFNCTLTGHLPKRTVAVLGEQNDYRKHGYTLRRDAPWLSGQKKHSSGTLECHKLPLPKCKPPGDPDITSESL